LDLFCKQGGATRGYQNAGWHVTGIDKDPQPRYCGDRFIQADAIAFLGDVPYLSRLKFDAIHASPPCQKFTQAQRIRGRAHPDLLTPARVLLNATGLPWVIENVPGSPMRPDLILCGSMFGLRWKGLVLHRHRWFEAGGWELSPFPPAACAHDGWSISIFGGSVLGKPLPGRSTYDHPNEREELGITVGREVMGIDWMNRQGLAQAIPPVYTEFIGRQLLTAVTKVAA